MKMKRLIIFFSIICVFLFFEYFYGVKPAVTPFIRMSGLGQNSYPLTGSGYTPAQISTAYGFSGQQTGLGQTVAIIDAYGSSNIQKDINIFDKKFDLPPTEIRVVNMSRDIAVNGDWAIETALDVEWCHALAPAARIVLVAAASDSTDDLLRAVDYANSIGAQVVSMSWGRPEIASENTYDSTYFSHTGTVYVAAAGDSGTDAQWPAASGDVLAVGGTTLTLDARNNRKSETAWGGSCGGASSYETEPAWQKTFGIDTKHSKRAVSDVAFDADPETGVAVYSSIDYAGTTGWFDICGTSLGAPAWAALIADGDQVKRIDTIDALLYRLAGGTSFSNSQVYFHDIASGSNNRNSASSGYDYLTGLGAPVANALIPAL